MEGPSLELLTDDQKKRLNDELLEEKQETSEPKRNSKDDLIRKITILCDENHLELEESTTKLRRMTKAQLQKKLAETAERAMNAELARQAGATVVEGASQSQFDAAIALGALRMVHDLVAGTVEKGANYVLPKYGWKIDGFVDSLRQPHVREATDACLQEIAANGGVMQYIESPYARLGIAWVGALTSSVKRAPKEQNDAADLGPDAPL